MKKIKSVILSEKEPPSDNLWIENGELKYFNNGKWEPLKYTPKESTSPIEPPDYIMDLYTYGVSWKPNVADPHLTRIGNMSYHKTLPIQSELKGCIFNPKEKNVVYWLDEDDWRRRKVKKVIDVGPRTGNTKYFDKEILKSLGIGPFTYIYVETTNSFYQFNLATDEEGISCMALYTTPVTELGTIIDLGKSTITCELGSNLAGYDGEVMVHVPEFWIKSWDEPDYKAVRLSYIEMDESWEHQPELFVAAYRDTMINTIPVDMGYLSTLVVGSAVSVVNNSIYCRGGSNRTNFDDYINTDVFKTDRGKSRVNLSRASMRNAARRANKEMLSYRQYKNIFYWLYVIEYANFNCQEVYIPELTSDGCRQGGLGEGITNFSNWNSYNAAPIIPCGFCNDLGNGTGIKEVTINGQILHVPRWRGFDNPFGHIFIHLDGIIISNNAVYTTNDPSKYNDTNTDIMVLSGHQLSINTYIKEFDLGSSSEIIPRLGGASPSSFVCDWAWLSSASFRSLLVGGNAVLGSYSGLGYFDSGNSPGRSSFNVGFRTSCLV